MNSKATHMGTTLNHMNMLHTFVCPMQNNFTVLENISTNWKKTNGESIITSNCEETLERAS